MSSTGIPARPVVSRTGSMLTGWTARLAFAEIAAQPALMATLVMIGTGKTGATMLKSAGCFAKIAMQWVMKATIIPTARVLKAYAPIVGGLTLRFTTFLTLCTIGRISGRVTMKTTGDSVTSAVSRLISTPTGSTARPALAKAVVQPALMAKSTMIGIGITGATTMTSTG